jgi:Copper transport outer membrane protein, MctB
VISWRYHLVSIVAVFLALALGVLAGTAVVNQNLVASLRKTTDNFAAKNKALITSNGFYSEYVDQAMKAIVNQRLAEENVVVVTDEGADRAALSEVRVALSAAGATVVTTLAPLPKLASVDPADTKALAADIGAPPQTDPAQLSAMVAQTLAARIAEGPPSAAHPGQQDVLERLLNDGFIDSRDPGVKSAADVKAPAAVIVVGGPTQGAVTPPATFLVPLVRELSAQRVVVAAGEARSAPDGFVALVRNVGVGVGPRVTVDDLEGPMGATALIVGLRQAIDQGVSGDYGTASGQLLPPLT